MDGEVIVLQAGDPWLTTSSLRTVGIFSDEEHFTEFTDKMLEKGIISDWGYKSLTGYYGMGRQCDHTRVAPSGNERTRQSLH